MAANAEESDDAWFAAHVYELVEKYPNQWIAVAGGQVICSSASRWGAKSEAKRITGRKDFSLYFIEPSMLQMGRLKGPSPPTEPPQ